MLLSEGDKLAHQGLALFVCALQAARLSFKPASLHFQHRLRHRGKQAPCKTQACQVSKILWPDDRSSLLL